MKRKTAVTMMTSIPLSSWILSSLTVSNPLWSKKAMLNEETIWERKTEYGHCQGIRAARYDRTRWRFKDTSDWWYKNETILCLTEERDEVSINHDRSDERELLYRKSNRLGHCIRKGRTVTSQVTIDAADATTRLDRETLATSSRSYLRFLLIHQDGLA